VDRTLDEESGQPLEDVERSLDEEPRRPLDFYFILPPFPLFFVVCSSLGSSGSHKMV
jgi:hypothetical protein